MIYRRVQHRPQSGNGSTGGSQFRIRLLRFVLGGVLKDQMTETVASIASNLRCNFCQLAVENRDIDGEVTIAD